MGRPPCCDKSNVKKGPWTAEEDAKILAYVSNYGIGNWSLVPKKAGLNRCGKSCRLRWTNYLRPDLKHDGFTPQEEELIVDLHKAIGSRWSLIAKQLPGRTDNDVKNYWNTKLKKKLLKLRIDPVTHKPISQVLSDFGNISSGSSVGEYHNARKQIESFKINYPISEPTLTNISSQYSNMSFSFSSTNNPSWDFLAQCSSPSSSSPSNLSTSCQQSEAQNLAFLAQQGEDFQGQDMMGKSCDGGISSSSATSFVEAILNLDCQMQMEFPLLLDESSYY